MVKIRLARTGKKHQPNYRIVVTDSRRKRESIVIERLGFYNPQTSPPTVKINKVRYQHWLAQGAQPTQTVRQLIQKSHA
jgi:small subunit ribosomal protein S16